MRLLILTISIIISSALVAQTSTTYTFRDIGWTIKLRNDFKIEDSFTVAKNTADGEVILENESHIDLSKATTKSLISARKDMFTYFSVTLSKSTAPNEHYWDSVNNRVIRVFYNAMVKQAAPTAKFDSSRTIETIDGIDFKCFRMNAQLNDKLTLYNFLITKLYKGSTLAINYYYTDESTGEELRKMLRESKFKK
jgi:hypothetical protein